MQKCKKTQKKKKKKENSMCPPSDTAPPLLDAEGKCRPRRLRRRPHHLTVRWLPHPTRAPKAPSRTGAAAKATTAGAVALARLPVATRCTVRAAGAVPPQARGRAVATSLQERTACSLQERHLQERLLLVAAEPQAAAAEPQAAAAAVDRRLWRGPFQKESRLFLRRVCYPTSLHSRHRASLLSLRSRGT